VLSGFDFARWRPRLILLEDHVGNLAKHRFLKCAGYRLIRRCENNGWYVPRDAAAAVAPGDRWEIVRKYYLALPFRVSRNASRWLRQPIKDWMRRRRASGSVPALTAAAARSPERKILALERTILRVLHRVPHNQAPRELWRRSRLHYRLNQAGRSAMRYRLCCGRDRNRPCRFNSTDDTVKIAEGSARAIQIPHTTFSELRNRGRRLRQRMDSQPRYRRTRTRGATRFLAVGARTDLRR
jgi:hypothetical protein